MKLFISSKEPDSAKKSQFANLSVQQMLPYLQKTWPVISLEGVYVSFDSVVYFDFVVTLLANTFCFTRSSWGSF